MTFKIYCSICGYENNSNNTLCQRCNELLHKDNILSDNKQLNSIDELFDNIYHQKLNDAILTLDSYEVIIQNIIESGENGIIYRKNMTPLERVVAIAKAYSIVITKEIGNNYGEYAYNVICIDKTFDSSIQIATILHELTHHLFNEILKQILIYVWNVKKSPLLDAFVQTLVSLPPVLLASEYCASKTEERYLPKGYVSYSSFNQIAGDLNYDGKILLNTFVIANGISESIIRILSNFIDNQLEDKIRQEFERNNTEEIANPICIEDRTINNPILRNVYLMNMITESYELLNDENYRHLIERNRELFEKAYEKIKTD